MEQKFTLAQLAHFNRCLFPDDFRKDLERIGTDYETVLQLYWHVQRHRSAGVVGIYQTFIRDKKCKKAILTLLTEHVAKYPMDDDENDDDTGD